MNFESIAIYLALAITISFVDLSSAQNRCDQLPLEVADFQILIENSPHISHFALTPAFNCTQLIMSGPAKGTSGYDGSAVSVQQTNAVVFQVTISADGKYVDSTICSSGQHDTWSFLKFQETSSGGYFCLFICDTDGINFAEFLCIGTDSSYIAAESQVVSSVSGIPNAANIYDSHTTCPTPQHCAIFN